MTRKTYVGDTSPGRVFMAGHVDGAAGRL
jgi:hypothetical protein